MRLIDADKLKESINISDSAIYTVLIEWLSQQPTIDIVKCKDCKFRTLELWNNEWKFCPLADGLVRPQTENDFCSYGERKEE